MNSSSENKSSSAPSSSGLKLFGFRLKASNDDDDNSVKKVQCPFCHRKFQNLQAMGGHQNAHRRERQMARLAQFEYMRVHQRNQIFQAVTPLVVAQGASPTSAFGGATRFWTAPVAEPPGTRHHNVQVSVVGVDDDIDLELRLANSSKESGIRSLGLTLMRYPDNYNNGLMMVISPKVDSPPIRATPVFLGLGVRAILNCFFHRQVVQSQNITYQSLEAVDRSLR
ncbi:unnamed protein product [Sphenostylis stenocarpa]|uniref:C2H2-type domain-containing protein n=1 Tax=Sphenostylis stenocarpa TaxID=92480 RepID=A0AA86V4M0_9FABA|nr:unnamed protein product [Sphenostylis stenocarpa]